jgi:hypothetical protein
VKTYDAPPGSAEVALQRLNTQYRRLKMLLEKLREDVHQSKDKDNTRKARSELPVANRANYSARRPWSSDRKASIASWAAWLEAGGTPPTARRMSSRVRDDASPGVLPRTSSVSAEPQAIEGTQPFA